MLWFLSTSRITWNYLELAHNRFVNNNNKKTTTSPSRTRWHFRFIDESWNSQNQEAPEKLENLGEVGEV